MNDRLMDILGPTVLGIPPGWELVTLVGGAHDGVSFWSRHPPRSFRVIASGDVYEQAGPGVYVAEGHEYEPEPPTDADQMALG